MDIKKIEHLFDSGWYKKLTPFLESKQFDDIIEFLRLEKKNGKKILPYDVDCFNAFRYCPYDKLKIVIVGQDPYHQLVFQRPEAHGLAFSYKPTDQHDRHIPKSLQNILKEVHRDVYNCTGLELMIEDTNLQRWAKQGVLLLNTALTVVEGNPGAHLRVWKPFTSYLIQLLNIDNPGLIWMLWGNDAKLLKGQINCDRHHILEAGHPSPLNTNLSTQFYGCGHFSKANELIKQMNGDSEKISW